MSYGANDPNGLPLGLPSILSLGLPPLVNPYPALNLDFINNQTLDSRITFTRATTATYFNSSGVLTTAASGAARFTYNPSTLQPLGLLIEEARTNSIRNNTMQGAVAGTPGTAPTNWLVPTPSNGLSRQIVGAGTENGINYVDIRYAGTTSAASLTAIYWETATGVAASSGQTWTNSVYVALVGGSTANITSVVVGMDENNSGGSFLAGGSTAFTPSSGALTGKRYSHTRTLSNASTAFVWPYVFFNYASGAAIDITLRIGLPQLELGAFATSVIPTTTTALTRNADVASMTGTNFSSWYNASEGTFVAETTVAAPRTTDFNVLRVDDGTSSNRAQVGSGSSAALFNGFLVTSGALQGNNTVSVSPLGTKKVAFAFTANNSVTVAAGTAGSTDTTVTVPSGINRLLFGRDDAASYLNGTISRIAYYPTRLPNATLQALTA